MADIQYGRGQIVSGLQESQDFKAAIGYVPVTSRSGKIFWSLPLAMYLLGNEKINAGRFATNPNEGNIKLDNVVDMEKEQWQFLVKPTGLSLDELSGNQYYNFFSGRGVTEMPSVYIPLSDLVKLSFESQSQQFEDPLFAFQNKLEQLESEKNPNALADPERYQSDKIFFYCGHSRT